MSSIDTSGTFMLGDRTVKRLGYGAMQLAGPGVFGPPRNRDEALAVLREAVASGVNHIVLPCHVSMPCSDRSRIPADNNDLRTKLDRTCIEAAHPPQRRSGRVVLGGRGQEAAGSERPGG